MKGEVLAFGYEPLYDRTAWQIPLAFKLWLVVTQADIAGSVMLQNTSWKSWPQYPSPPQRLQVSVLLAPWQGSLGALPACPWWPGDWQHGLAPSCTATFLHQWFGDAEHGDTAHGRLWGLPGCGLCYGVTLRCIRAAKIVGGCWGRGGVCLSASSWLLWSSFFISRSFVFWKLLQYSFKSETRSELCEATRKIYLKF